MFRKKRPDYHNTGIHDDPGMADYKRIQSKVLARKHKQQARERRLRKKYMRKYHNRYQVRALKRMARARMGHHGYGMGHMGGMSGMGMPLQ